MDKLNIRTLASQLKLSVSTVSKALRNSHEISEETRKKVLDLAASLRYTPNAYASSLRRKISKTIAVVLPEVADSFFSLAINGIQSVAKEKGYHLLIYLSHEKLADEQHILNDFQSGRVDGVLISVSGETNNADHIAQLLSHKIPLVFFDRAYEHIDTASITTNDRACGHLAATHLLENNCKKPAFITISTSLSICIQRMEGCLEALESAGIPQQSNTIIHCHGSEQEHYEQIKKVLQQPDRPDGIIAATEKTAIQLYLVCQELGIVIPRDLKVVAFSTLETAPILNPSLTTITQPAFEIGKTAVTVLFKGIEKEHFDLKNEKIVLPSVLIQRDSTR